MAITCPTQSVSHIQMITSDPDASASLITSCGLAAAEELATRNYFNLICLFYPLGLFQNLVCIFMHGGECRKCPSYFYIGAPAIPRVPIFIVGPQ